MRRLDVATNAPSPEEIETLAQGLTDGREAEIAKLRADLAAAAALPAQERWPSFLQRPKDYVDTREGGRPTSHRPVLGPVLVALKTGFRKSFQPFINEVLRTQVRFNEAILDAVAHVHDEIAQHAENQALFRRQVERRLAALERNSKKTSP